MRSSPAHWQMDARSRPDKLPVLSSFIHLFIDEKIISPQTSSHTLIRVDVWGIFLVQYQHSSGSRCRSWPRRDIRPSQIYSSDRKPCAFARYLWFHDPSRFRKIHSPRYSRSEEHTSELQSLMRISYAVFCLKKKKQNQRQNI